ncbi:class I SAM-dependent methyltransferase [Bacillus mycoides]|uniref:class I SAM-dependent methyltransferase n=1 Tax=Bacillus mycoides TaxID=1405 RepID=UPI00103E103E|nr:class I SAM-dependent methyltransferase [Bacillus mycoides]MBJ7997438.1 class I SAM-dependent methyltransferase [Bacillus cereus]MBE7128692.1 class I SAM-dependent methyltransferase [Bacillus mycoides]MED1406440.1 class I SAM-dependent methyltransferase [Bacillus mycoides]TBX52500.1 class I SAM-dependent methyltransferase [Bacillus mycoides]UNJ93383.1 class I SAM-dependent methyltransferase [Bacillus mycoides]
MNELNVKEFYQKQFELSNYDINTESWLEQVAKEVQEQVGHPFQAMLELGAGNGRFARAMSRLQVKMTTVELVPELVMFAKEHSTNNIDIHCADFYKINFEEKFDVVSYLDGFGVGTDDEQLILLKRIKNWMKDDGCALIDIYQPLYWKKVSGQEMSLSAAMRKYEYDSINERMLDHWWDPNYPNDVVTQSLRCYTVDEISNLCAEAGLSIMGFFPGGAYDFEKRKYKELATLNECLAYRIKVRKSRD